MGKTAVKKWGFDAQKRVIGLEKLRAGNQTRRAKWCKMQDLCLKIDNFKDMKGQKKWLFAYFLTYILARME